MKPNYIVTISHFITGAHVYTFFTFAEAWRTFKLNAPDADYIAIFPG